LLILRLLVHPLPGQHATATANYVTDCSAGAWHRHCGRCILRMQYIKWHCHCRRFLWCSLQVLQELMAWPYPGIAPGGYSVHYTNTNPNPYPGANPG